MTNFNVFTDSFSIFTYMYICAKFHDSIHLATGQILLVSESIILLLHVYRDITMYIVYYVEKDKRILALTTFMHLLHGFV